MSNKRSATSPAGNMSKKDKDIINPHETAKEKVVKIELVSINGKPFFGQISEEEILYIWLTVFEKPRELLFGGISSKSLTRNVRVTFKLTAPIDLFKEFPSEHFSYEKFLGEAAEKVEGRILGYVKIATLGQPTLIEISTNFGVEPPGILNWLQRYGVTSSKYSFKKNDAGFYTDVFVIEVTLHRHVPEFLPMYGQKVVINYPGIPKVCVKCYRSGHMKRACNNPQRLWIDFISDLVEEENVPADYIGSWGKAIENHKNANIKR